VNNEASKIVVDPLSPDTFWECGIYGSAVCRSTDGGTTITALGSLSHNDDMSVDFGDPLRQTILLSGHEASQTLNVSGDGGATWKNVGANLPAGTAFSAYPLILDSNTFVVGCSGQWGSGTPGIYRSTDKGTSWAKVSDFAAYGDPAVTSKGHIYFTEVFNRGVFRSTDAGVTWQRTTGYGSCRFGVRICEAPDKKLYASSALTNGLCVSPTGGPGWVAFGDRTSAAVNSVAYSTIRKAFFVVAGGVFRYDYDATSDVKSPARVRPNAAGTEKSFTVTGANFLVPPGLTCKTIEASVYGSNGRLVSRMTLRPGERIKLPLAQPNAVSVIKFGAINR
jgi:photosystem II stability/assembly factor-like uncharacterized protein